MNKETPGQAARQALQSVVAAMGGQPRAEQEEMTAAVAEAIAQDEVALVQAGTGTGKTLGYLVPTMQAITQNRGGVAVLSTATLALQRQLVEHDIPLANKALGADVSVALLKGRNNYICRARLTGEDSFAFDDDSDLGRREKQARKLAEWANETDTGDRDDVDFPVEPSVWRSFSVTSAECIGPSKCQFADECFSEVTRRRALESSLVVTNHTLLALTAAEGGLLPEHSITIIDEAHSFGDRATSAATQELPLESVRRLAKAANHWLEDSTEDSLEHAVSDVARVLGELGPDNDRFNGELPNELVPVLADLRDSIHVAMTEINAADESNSQHRASVDATELHSAVGRILALASDEVVWINEDRTVIRIAPLSVEEVTAAVREATDSLILTSATLTVGGDFQAISAELGVQDATTVDVGSPFDYPKQGILYVAQDLPNPGSPTPAATLDRAVELVSCAGGGALVLANSWRAVGEFAERLQEEKALHVLVQEAGVPIPKLVAEFAAHGNAVLVGTMSLFQGIDIPGRALRLVVMERVPFPRPDDPILAARGRQAERSGRSGFDTVMVPRAATLLAQAAGRLIRRMDDRGMVAVLDPRMRTKGYGRYLIKSLPPFWLTADEDQALASLRRLADSGT